MEDYGPKLRKSKKFKPFLLAFIKKQIQTLLQELSYESGVESILILADIENNISHSLGSTYSSGYVETTNIRNEFLSYCTSRYQAGDVPVNTSMLVPKLSPWGLKGKKTSKSPSVSKIANGSKKKNETAAINSENGDANASISNDSKGDNNTNESVSNDMITSLDTNKDSGMDSQMNYNDVSGVVVKKEITSNDENTNTSMDLMLNNDFSNLPTNNNQHSVFGPIRFVRKFPPKERTTLSLPEKILVIEDYESGAISSQRRLAEKYNISKSAVADMLKNRQLLKDHFEFNANTKRKRFNTTSRFAEINEVVWQWFKTARENGIQMSGPMIQEKALQVAKTLQVNDFKGSNGWLHSWRSRYNVTSYRDENAPPHKQTYVNDYSKLDPSLNNSMEISNNASIMNYGTLLPGMNVGNDPNASFSQNNSSNYDPTSQGGVANQIGAGNMSGGNLSANNGSAIDNDKIQMMDTSLIKTEPNSNSVNTRTADQNNETTVKDYQSSTNSGVNDTVDNLTCSSITPSSVYESIVQNALSELENTV